MAQGLREVREYLLIAYACDLIDDEEFLLLMELHDSRELYPYYWKFEKFDTNKNKVRLN